MTGPHDLLYIKLAVSKILFSDDVADKFINFILSATSKGTISSKHLLVPLYGDLGLSKYLLLLFDMLL